MVDMSYQCWNRKISVTNEKSERSIYMHIQVKTALPANIVFELKIISKPVQEDHQ